MWQYDDQGKWSSVPFVAHPSDDYDPPTIPQHELSPLQKTSVAQNPNAARTDNTGSLWFTGGGKLYRCISDQWVSIFAPGEVTPFGSNPALLRVDVDGQGNAFINAFAGETHRYLVRAKRPPPQTTITLKQVDEDSFSATFDPHSDGTVKFRWQLDDNTWNASDSSTITLHHLTNGPHTIRAISIDDQLNMDTSLAIAHCEVKIDPDKQTASLIAQLLSSDDALRKEAVEVLAREPNASLPALLKAKATATGDQLWWIQVAVQEAERKQASAAGQGSK